LNQEESLISYKSLNEASYIKDCIRGITLNQGDNSNKLL